MYGNLSFDNVSISSARTKEKILRYWHGNTERKRNVNNQCQYCQSRGHLWFPSSNFKVSFFLNPTYSGPFNLIYLLLKWAKLLRINVIYIIG